MWPLPTPLGRILLTKLQYLGSDKGMICLDKLRQAYMLTAINIREAHSMQTKQRYDDIPNYKIGDLVMIKNFDRKVYLGCKLCASELCTW